jgi:uncharacterized RDD family membrane protein YckC
MMPRATLRCLLLLLAALTTPYLAAAQPPPSPPVEKPDRPEARDTRQPDEAEQWEREAATRPALRIGSDYALMAGDEAREVTVISGKARIAGHVYRDVVVVLGSAEIAATAVIERSLTVVGGNAIIRSGATIGHDLVVIGGSLDAPEGFKPGGEHVVIGSQLIGGRIEAFVPWITRGLMWGRLIVPDLAWVWWVVGFFFFLYLMVSLLADRPVRACATVVAQKPLTTFLVGLAVLCLMGPVAVILAASVIGIPVVPFALCALALAGLVGKVGVARWLGQTIVPEGTADEGSGASRALATRSFVIGCVVICVALMIPVLGIVAWASLGVMGIGAGASAFIAYYQRENPPKPRAAWPPSGDAGGAGFSPAPPLPPLLPADESPAAAPSAQADLAGFPYAPFRDRLAAFVLDIILVAVAAALLDLVPRGHRWILMLLAYHVAFWAWKGTTVGGIICQLRVVRTTGQRLSFADALVRGLSSIFSLAVLGIGALWILRDPDRQAWHDKIAGTYVVKVPRHYPY